MGATAAIIVSAAGIGLSAAGQVRAGSMSQNIASVNAANIERIAEINAELIEQGSEDNARVAEFNARMLDAQARDAIYRGRETEDRFREETRSFIGAQRASYAAQGVLLSDGSALDVQKDTAYQGELDAITIRVNAARESWGFRIESEDSYMQAENIRKQGRMSAKSTREVGRIDALSTRMGGKQAGDAGRAGAVSTVVGGAGNLLYQRYGFRGA
jgi:hypothetical protein